MLKIESVMKTLKLAEELRLLSESERSEVMAAFDAASPFADAVRLADSMHAHIKVDAVTEVPHADLRAAGGEVENEKDGYIKYAFASGMNLIFSSIAVSQDDLRETPATRRARPFLDHYGIDLRRETPGAARRIRHRAAPGRRARMAARSSRGRGHACILLPRDRIGETLAVPAGARRTATAVD